MKKINILLIILFGLLTTNCGYHPILLKKDLNFNISDIQSNGDRKINNKITKNLKKFKNNLKTNRNLKIVINTKKNTNVITKDERGNDSRFLLKINVRLQIFDKETLLKEENFNKEFAYNSLQSKLDLSRYKKQIEETLINKIIEEISVFIYSIE